MTSNFQLSTCNRKRGPCPLLRTLTFLGVLSVALNPLTLAQETTILYVIDRSNDSVVVLQANEEAITDPDSAHKAHQPVHPPVQTQLAR